MTTFQLAIPEDPTWEPMEFSDVLEQDGAYCAVISGEKVTTINDKTGIMFTFKLQDPDVAGRTLSKFLQDPRQNEKVMFLWRGMMRSLAGSTEGARGGVQYVPGAWTGGVVYFKVESYINDKDGERKSGIGQLLTKSEYDTIVATGKQRWAPQVRGGSRGAAAGTPNGLPTGFPGMPGVVPPPPATQPVVTGGPLGGFTPPVAPAVPAPAGFGFAPPAPAAPVAPPPAPPAPPAAGGFSFPGIKK